MVPSSMRSGRARVGLFLLLLLWLAGGGRPRPTRPHLSALAQRSPCVDKCGVGPKSMRAPKTLPRRGRLPRVGVAVFLNGHIARDRSPTCFYLPVLAPCSCPGLLLLRRLTCAPSRLVPLSADTLQSRHDG